MRRATITIPDDLDQALEAFMKDQAVAATLTAVAQTALREFLVQRGYLPSGKRFWLTPAEHGSDESSVSLEHDRVFAEEHV
jgi:hypothetical protein